MKFFNRERQDGSNYSVPLSPKDPRMRGIPETPKYPKSLIASPSVPSSPQQEKAKKILADTYNEAEKAGEMGYLVRDAAIELLEYMDTKGLTLKHFDLITQRAISAFSSYQEVDARITPEIFERGLHVHKISAKAQGMIDRSKKTLEELEKIGKRIKTHYPQYSSRWALIIERQNGVVEMAEKVKTTLISLFEGDVSISLSEPTL